MIRLGVPDRHDAICGQVIWSHEFERNFAISAGFQIALPKSEIIARELGGRPWAIALACAGSLCALFNLAVANFFSMNAFEPLFWMGAVYLVVRIINGGSPTLWVWFGVLLGFGTDDDDERQLFGSVGDLGQVVSSPRAMPFERRRHIYLCRDLKVGVRDLWPRVKNWL